MRRATIILIVLVMMLSLAHEAVSIIQAAGAIGEERVPMYRTSIQSACVSVSTMRTSRPARALRRNNFCAYFRGELRSTLPPKIQRREGGS